ncbi:MAG: TonB-dependent receptor [Planctomycetota bacterium]
MRNRKFLTIIFSVICSVCGTVLAVETSETPTALPADGNDGPETADDLSGDSFGGLLALNLDLSESGDTSGSGLDLLGLNLGLDDDAFKNLFEQVFESGRIITTVKDNPASITVITAEDIRQSGYETIPDILRTAVGVHVIQTTGSSYGVTTRGLGDMRGARVLVLIDGRTMYNNTDGGTRWAWLPIMVEDISKIEIIRGPGGSLYGSNSIQGVINIVSKKSSETAGVYSTVQGGEQYHYTMARVGQTGLLPQSLDFSYRLSLSERGSRGMAHEDEGVGDDTFLDYTRERKLNLMLGIKPSPEISATLDAGFLFPFISREYITYDGVNCQIEDMDTKADYQDLTVVRTPDAGRTQTYKLYHNHMFSNNPETQEAILYEENAGIEFHASETLSEALSLQFGLEYRANVSDLPTLYDDGDHFRWNLRGYGQLSAVGLGAQKQIDLFFGVSLDYANLAGLEMPPSVSGVWRLSADHILRASVRQAHRPPAGYLNYLDINIPSVMSVRGNEDLKAETIYAYEIGYRGKLSTGLTVDMSLFLDRYLDVHYLKSEFNISTMMLETNAVNSDGELYSMGFEFEAAYRPTSADKNSFFLNHTLFKVNYAFIEFDRTTDAEAVGHYTDISPQHQLNFSVNWQRSRYSANLVWHYQDIYSSIIDDFVLGTIPAMNRLDARLGAYIIKDANDLYGMELFVMGRNLLGETTDGPSGAFEDAVIPTQYIVGLNGKYVF